MVLRVDVGSELDKQSHNRQRGHHELLDLLPTLHDRLSALFRIC